MREFIAEKVCVIEVGAENNPASPLYTKAFEVGEEQPILAQKNINGSYSINVNKDYYEKNKEYAESLIIEILKATKEEMICLVPRELFTDSLIEIIKANDNIKSVSFWGSARISKDLLSKEIIDSISLWNYLDLLGLIKEK